MNINNFERNCLKLASIDLRLNCRLLGSGRPGNCFAGFEDFCSYEPVEGFYQLLITNKHTPWIYKINIHAKAVNPAIFDRSVVTFKRQEFPV